MHDGAMQSGHRVPYMASLDKPAQPAHAPALQGFWDIGFGDDTQ